MVQEQAALAAEGCPREAASPLRGVRPAALVHVEALRQQAEAASAEARLCSFCSIIRLLDSALGTVSGLRAVWCLAHGKRASSILFKGPPA